jgi:hypothetical protein
VLSNDIPLRVIEPSGGIAFHSLQATSHALQPIHTEVSVKKPLRAGGCCQPARRAGSGRVCSAWPGESRIGLSLVVLTRAPV